MPAKRKRLPYFVDTNDDKAPCIVERESDCVHRHFERGQWSLAKMICTEMNIAHAAGQRAAITAIEIAVTKMYDAVMDERR